MLSKEVNERLTRVGAGTPAGELLRRYWHPVAVEGEISEDKPIKRVRALGEDLVLFRDGRGRLGLLEEHCCHRSASLAYGFVEEDGLRCPYHGWKYDRTGRCLEQPFEPDDSPLKDQVRQIAYKVEVLGGLIFAYMGPDPAPLLPNWDQLLRDDGVRTVFILPRLNCNWLQVMENSVDPTHTYYLHAHTLVLKGKGDKGAYYYRPIEEVNFEIVKQDAWCGVTKQRIYGGEDGERELGHPVIFPTFLLSPQREHIVMHMRLPVDDTHTQIFRYQFTPTEDGSAVAQPDIVPHEYVPPVKNEDGEYHMDTFGSHDAMAWETQGEITNRSREHLGTADKGIALYRRLLSEQIKAVEEGGDPHGVIRDAAINKRIRIEVSSGQARVARKMAKA
ncbi:MAG: Rieske 2Fe-2S domain-containing protein [Alphaproteobacteria bacterium]